MTTKDVEQPPPTAANEWWRWALMPFACIAGSTIGAVALGYVLQLASALEVPYGKMDYLGYLAPFLASGALGYLWVQIAAIVAPTGKLITAIVMGTILGTALLLLTVYMWTHPDFADDPFKVTVCNAATVAAGIYAIMSLVRSEREIAHLISCRSRLRRAD